MLSKVKLNQLLIAVLTIASKAIAQPCDIYAAGKTPCVAAHSTTRALYKAYSGKLYQVTRGSDGATQDISTLSAGGIANAAAQDTFCASTTCSISIIYDQSANANDLTPAPPGGAASGPGPNGFDIAASAVGAPVFLNGRKVYGVFIQPGSGYRNDVAKGTATGDAPQGMYAVVDGKHYNDGCCFDYGNAETNNHDNGNGHMEAIYFGSSNGYGTGTGSGPWVMADMENGLFSSDALATNPNAPSLTSRFVTAVVKGKPGTWAVRGGDSTTGTLQTYWNGSRPSPGYNPMSKEGAIILGIGGDNSISAQGTFYEGVMTSGYPFTASENAVQANVVGARYSVAPLVSGPAFTVGSTITLRATTACCSSNFIAHNGATVSIQPVSASSSAAQQQQASWIVRTGLGNSGCYSFESVDTPGSFLRHYAFQILLNANDGSKLFSEDATYCPQTGLAGQGNSIRSWSFPTRFFRHYSGTLYLGQNGGPENFDAQALFNNDTTFVMSSGFSIS